MLVDNRPGRGGGGGVSDHGALSGLADDDHSQYHNNARGDARYPLLTDYNEHVADLISHNIHPTLGWRIIENWYSGTVAGNNGWAAVNNTGSSGMNISVGSGTRMGIFRLETLGNTAASPILTLGGGASIALGGMAHVMDCEVLIGSLATVTDDFDVKIGFHNGALALWTNAVMFEYDRGTSGDFWRCITRSASGATTTTVTGTAVTAAWVRLTIRINSAGTEVLFYVNGTLVATHSTAANIPSGVSQPVSPSFHIIKSAGTNSRVLYGDWCTLGGGAGAIDPWV